MPVCSLGINDAGARHHLGWAAGTGFLEELLDHIPWAPARARSPGMVGIMSSFSLLYTLSSAPRPFFSASSMTMRSCSRTSKGPQTPRRNTAGVPTPSRSRRSGPAHRRLLQHLQQPHLLLVQFVVLLRARATARAKTGRQRRVSEPLAEQRSVRHASSASPVDEEEKWRGLAALAA